MKYQLILLIAALVMAASIGCTPNDQSADTDADAAADSADTHPHGHSQHHSGPRDTTLPLHTSDFDGLVDKFESDQRADWQKPDEVLAKLGDLKGYTVADIGAGTGYFAFRMAKTAKRVIAVDVNEKFVRYMNKRRLKENVTNVETRLAEYHNPYLGTNEVDLILLVDVYHHIQNRIDYFKLVRSTIKPFGSLWIVDFKKGDLPHGPPNRAKLSPDAVVKELKLAGYEQFSVDTTTLDYQYIIEAKP